MKAPADNPSSPQPDSRPLRIAVWPEYRGANAYLTLFYSVLSGLNVRTVGSFVPETGWLTRHASSTDALHIHWPEKLWRRSGRSAAAHLYGLMRLRAFLRAARAHGMRTIWTMHNAEGHEGASWLDRAGYEMLVRCVDLVISHSAASASAVSRHARRVVVVPHGSYGATYPSPRARENVLRDLGLDPALPAVCALGLLRTYKGLDTAVDAIARLRGRVQLVIAGHAHRRFDLVQLQQQIARTRGCVLVPRLLSDQEFADFAAASEAVLLPYRKITGSGVLLAAWTLDRGVIASDLPFFREMLNGEADAGRLVPPEDSSALASAIEEYVKVPAWRRSAAAARQSDRYAWDRCVEPLRPVFCEWIRERDR